MEIRIIIAGSGGQGILFLGRLICQTALLEDRNVTWFPSYGAEMRGGTANCTVVISETFIGSPVVLNPDILIILNQASLKRFLSRLHSGGTVYYDSSLVSYDGERRDISACPVPSSQIAGEIGNPRFSNMVLLGAFTEASGIVSRESILGAVPLAVSSKRSALIEKNILAITKGAEFIENQESARP